MSRSLALCSDQSPVYRRDLGKLIVRRAGMPLRRKLKTPGIRIVPPPARSRSSVLLICTGGLLSQHRDYGEITGGQNALSPVLNIHSSVASVTCLGTETCIRFLRYENRSCHPSLAAPCKCLCGTIAHV